jgi:hypothetical protein
MNRILVCLVVIIILASCQENAVTESEFTGRETVYALQPGSAYAISGTVTFKERIKENTLILISLTGTEGEIQHPVHLHLGDISAPGAEIYAVLNPVSGKTGKSETILSQLADETSVSYQDLLEMEASIKIHLAESGPDRDIILAGGNVGELGKSISSGRVEIGVCKSN